MFYEFPTKCFIYFVLTGAWILCIFSGLSLEVTKVPTIIPPIPRGKTGVNSPTTTSSPAITSSAVCTKLKCEAKDHNNVVFRFMSGHTIENHTITNTRAWHSTFEADESSCVKKCIAIPECITVVVAGNVSKCWIYVDDDVYMYPETIQPKQGHKIISLGNGVCKTQPCNDGKCVPNFDGSGKYTCKCNEGYVGEKCQIKGAQVYFSFDKDTSHPNVIMEDLKMILVQGKLTQVPDRRGKVLLVKHGEQAVRIEMQKSFQRGAWMSNPFVSGKRVRVTFWVKLGRTASGNNLRNIITMPHWNITYSEKEKKLRAIISPLAPSASMALDLTCTVEQIERWTFVTLAMNGLSKIAKFYVNGELCESKVMGDISGGNIDWDSETWDKFLFYENKGISLIDELKFYKSLPPSDDALRKNYQKEMDEYMS